MESVKSSFQTLVELGLLQKGREPQSQKPAATKPPLALKPSQLPKDDTSSIDLNDTQQSKCSSIKEELKELLDNDSRLQAICHSFHSKPAPQSSATPPPKRLLTPKKAAKLGTLLYERGQDMMRNRKLHAQELFDREHPFKPHIDPNSSKLVEQPGARRPLYSPRVVTEDTVSTQEEEPRQTLTPTRLKRFILRNYNTPIEKRKGQVSRAQVLQPDLECTFSPRVNPASTDFPPVCATQHPKGSLYNRAMDYLQRRRERSESGERSKAEREVKDCTFTPEISGRTTPKKERSDCVRSRKEPVDIREALRTVERLSKKLTQ